MRDINLDYFTLLSPEPLFLQKVGHIRPITLREIAKLNYRLYSAYIGILINDIDDYYKGIDSNQEGYFTGMAEADKENVLEFKDRYKEMTDEEKQEYTLFDVVLLDPFYVARLEEALNFFISESVTYSNEYGAFVVRDKNRLTNTQDNEDVEDSIIGFVYSKNYKVVVDIILQMNGIVQSKKKKKDKPKFKNKIAYETYMKFFGDEDNDEEEEKVDAKFSIPNLISALSTHSKSLNITNIWDITVYQLYDQFKRQRYEDGYKRNSFSVSVWGDKENKFDDSVWFASLE